MSDKYIVKNCPARVDLYCYSPQNRQEFIYCQDCTDCQIKQVIEKCKEVQDKEYKKGSWKFRSPSKAKFGREILQLFDIEEVE